VPVFPAAGKFTDLVATTRRDVRHPAHRQARKILQARSASTGIPVAGDLEGAGVAGVELKAGTRLGL